MAKGNQMDLFHRDGNSTVGLPSSVKSNKKKMTDPHTSPGALLPTKKVVQKGWSK